MAYARSINSSILLGSLHLALPYGALRTEYRFILRTLLIYAVQLEPSFFCGLGILGAAFDGYLPLDLILKRLLFFGGFRLGVDAANQSTAAPIFAKER